MSQITKNKDLKNGEHIWKYDNGQIGSREYYLLGKPQGHRKTWYINGQVQQKVYQASGQYHGHRKWWGRDGQLTSRINYIDGWYHGLREVWCVGRKFWEKRYYIYKTEVNGKKYREYQSNKGMVLSQMIQIQDLVNFTLLFL